MVAGAGAFSKSGSNRHDVLEAVTLIVRHGETLFGAESGFVAWNTARAGRFELTVFDPARLDAEQLSDEPLQRSLPAPLRPLAKRATTSGRPAFSNGLEGRQAESTHSQRMRNALVAPILLREGEVAGLIGLINKPGGFSPVDRRLATALARLAAATMAINLDAAESRSSFVDDALREATAALTRSLDRETVLATLLDRLGHIVPYDRACVMLLEEARRVSVRAVFDGSHIQRLQPEARTELDLAEHPVVDHILNSGAPLVIPDLRERADWTLPTDPTIEVAWMGVPLFARGSVAGLFSLSKGEPGYFNDEHLKLAEAMSSQASVAVENAILYEQMRASTLRMQNLSRRLVDVQETERREIARELHDEAGQALVSLRFGLRLMEREVEEGANVRERVAELVKKTDLVIESLHRLAADLRPISLDHVGLDAALRQNAATVIPSSTTTVRYKARGLTGQRLPAEVETAVFRIAQEAMTNVARHADASNLDLLVEHLGDRIQVVIEDDGVGFDAGRGWDGDHIGLIGMRERAESLGGTFTIETAIGKGTTIVVEVPIGGSNPDC